MDKAFRCRVEWYCLVSGLTFLGVSTYFRMAPVFASGNVAGSLILLAMASALLTLVLAVMSLPRWQSFFGFAVFAYAIYWVLFAADYAIA